MLVNPRLKPTLTSTHLVAPVNDSYNIVAVKLSAVEQLITVITAYRAPWASARDSKEFFADLDSLLSKTNNVLLVGDFNLPEAKGAFISQPTSPLHLNDGKISCLYALIDNHNLEQINCEPSREKAFLDLVLVSPSLIQSTVVQRPPVAGSDHMAQLIDLYVHTESLSEDCKASMCYEQMAAYLTAVDWHLAFAGCKDVDDYAAVFSAELDAAYIESTVYTRHRRRKRDSLPKYILKLICKKNEEWRKSVVSGDRSKYCEARNKFRAAVSSWRAECERNLLCGRNKCKFYRYINKRLGRNAYAPIAMKQGNNIVLGVNAAEMLSMECASNFKAYRDGDVECGTSCASENGLQLNCSLEDIVRSIRQSPNTAAGPDGYSFSMLKMLEGSIVKP